MFFTFPYSVSCTDGFMRVTAREEVRRPSRRLRWTTPHDAQAHPWLPRQATTSPFPHSQGGSREDPRRPRLPHCTYNLPLRVGLIPPRCTPVLALRNSRSTNGIYPPTSSSSRGFPHRSLHPDFSEDFFEEDDGRAHKVKRVVMNKAAEERKTRWTAGASDVKH